jgi:hypothetical protein
MYLDTIHTLQSLKNYFPPILAIPNWCTETVEKSGILLSFLSYLSYLSKRNFLNILFAGLPAYFVKL